MNAEVLGFLQFLAAWAEGGGHENVTNLTREAAVNDVISQLAEAPGAASGFLLELLACGRGGRQAARAPARQLIVIPAGGVRYCRTTRIFLAGVTATIETDGPPG